MNPDELNLKHYEELAEELKLIIEQLTKSQGVEDEKSQNYF